MRERYAAVIPYTGDESVSEIRRNCRKILTELDRQCGTAVFTESLPADAVLEMLRCSETVSMNLRKALGSARSADPAPREPAPVTALPVSVDMCGDVLKLTFPPAVYRKPEHSRYLPYCAAEALRAYVAKNGEASIGQPAFVICRRITDGYEQSYRDNENYEVSRIINSVMDVLGYTDRPDHLGYASVFARAGSGEENRMELLFLSLATLTEHPEFLAF